MTLPLAEHPLRQRLNDEVHARPPMALEGPEWISYLAVLHEGTEAAAEEAHLQRLCAALGANLCPVIQGDHWVMDAGRLRLKWERHNEFSGYTFFLAREPGDAPDTTAISALPADWLAGLPGSVMVATHVEFRSAADLDPEELLADLHRSGDSWVATTVADGAAWVASDFQLHDGWSRFLVLDERLRHRQAGRTVQRLLEIETYRMMALLAFPVAKEVSRLLARLTRLAAEIERSVTRTAFRFGAAEAYYALVQQRVRELREHRLNGFPPISEFMDRRLAPAINTCLSVARRQTDLSTRIARKSALLRTRVDIELERQNQQLLGQMNRRAKLQLRLQETVEGLSKTVLPHLSPEIASAVSIPLIAAVVAVSIRRMRRALAAEELEQGEGH